MYPHQIERLTGALDAAAVEALVARSAANVAYVTGFRSFTHAWLRVPHYAVFGRRGTALVVHAADVAAAVADDVEVDHIVCFSDPPPTAPGPPGPLRRRVEAIVGQRAASAPDALAAALEALAIREGPIGLEAESMSGDEWTGIAGRLGSLRPVPGSEPLRSARRVKAPFEIECLAGALRIAEEALNEVIQMLKRGVTEREATALYVLEVVKRGGEPWPSAITMGDRTALGATWPSDRGLRPRELVRLDVGCAHRGYVARVGRTAVLGEPSAAHDAAHGAIEGGLDAAVAAAAPGRTAGELYAAAERAMREAGLLHFRSAAIGHGIGLEPGEPPWLSPGDATALEAGEVLSIELGHETAAQEGFLARDTVLVTVGGARVLNRSSRGLVSLD
jgi:Xaa-Pro aminopeptidase